MDAPVIKNENYTMTVTDLGKNAEGIGRVDGFTVFVEGALPQDEIELKIIKVKKSFAFGKLINIIKPSPDRITPKCEHFKRCGGCQLQHYSYDAQLKLKRDRVREQIERIGGFQDVLVHDTIGMENPWEYRNKAQLPVGRSESGKCEIGFYEKRSHKIVDINYCAIQHRVSEKVIKCVREFVEKNNISCYNEETNRGIIRHVLCRVGVQTGEIMVCIVINAKSLPKSDELTKMLCEIDGMTSVVININMKQTNVIMGDTVKTIWGKDFICDYIGEVKFEISALSFYQVNPVQTKILYEKAVEFAQLSGNENVLDLYCGIGTISLFVAKNAKSVLGVEIVPQAIEDAKHNAQINAINNAKFECGASEEIIAKLCEENEKYDVVILDPPRKGCDREVLESIVSLSPSRIVYVSCDPATLARDLRVLADGGYGVKEVQPVDQFGFSVHVECAVLMQRSGE